MRNSILTAFVLLLVACVATTVLLIFVLGGYVYNGHLAYVLSPITFIPGYFVLYSVVRQSLISPAVSDLKVDDRNVLIITFPFASAIFVLGWFLKFLEWPGGSVSVILGTLMSWVVTGHLFLIILAKRKNQ